MLRLRSYYYPVVGWIVDTAMLQISEMHQERYARQAYFRLFAVARIKTIRLNRPIPFVLLLYLVTFITF